MWFHLYWSIDGYFWFAAVNTGFAALRARRNGKPSVGIPENVALMALPGYAELRIPDDSILPCIDAMLEAGNKFGGIGPLAAERLAKLLGREFVEGLQNII